MKKYSKKLLYTFICILIGIIIGVNLLVCANTYSSSEISYDNSTSHASATNVKDAIDYLYSHGSCGEGMSCLESPTVTINISGPGEISETNIKVPVYGRKQVTVTPDSGYVLRSFSCDNGYTLSDFKSLTILAADQQNIEIINSGILTDATCEVHFGLNELVEVNIASTQFAGDYYGGDNLSSPQIGAGCYYLGQPNTVFDYGNHKNCSVKNRNCVCSNSTYSRANGSADAVADCSTLYWSETMNCYAVVPKNIGLGAVCSGTLECET